MIGLLHCRNGKKHFIKFGRIPIRVPEAFVEMILVSSYSFRLPNTLALVINVRPLSKGLHCISKNSIGQSLGLKSWKLDFYRQISTSNPLIWFHLYDYETGKPYKDTSVTSVLRSSLVVPVIDQFRDAVKVKFSNKLSSIDAADLKVFKNKQSFDRRNSKEENVNDFIILQTGSAA